MARQVGRMSALAVTRATRKGMYADGGGLYLQVTSGGAKSWIFRYMLHGRAREMGLGPLHTVSLAEARIKATEYRRLRLEGIDPIDARHGQRNQLRLEAAKATTFDQCATSYIDAHRAGWKNAKHADQWKNTLDTYPGPVFGQLPVQAVDTALVMKVIEPIWESKPETASRVRGRIELVLDWATARGYRQGDNPARWRGHLDKLLPNRSKVRKVVHHPALPYAEIADCMKLLRAQNGTAARALEFLILTAARTGEVIGATWDEIHLNERLWTVPAERIKGGKEHRVPMSSGAMAVLTGLRGAEKEQGYIFAGGKPGKPLSNMALLAVLKRMKRSDLTAHGFRSTFRDWAAECTNYPREVAEMALAHVIENKVEAAYRRGNLFEKRQAMMDDWGRYCRHSSKIDSGV
ncbi:MAG: putative phage integrase [Rhodospirillales bacterium]|nr:putative phage integrase [Rhodospirillales bacterium]